MNGSFRGKNSNSNYFLDVLEAQLNEKCERVHLNQVKGIDEVDEKLKTIMKDIYKKVDEASRRYGMERNFVAGANIAGFEKVVNSMKAQGPV